MNVSEIMRAMEEEGKIASRATIRKRIFRRSSCHGLQDQHRCGAKSRIASEIAAYLEKKLGEDDEVPFVELQKLIARNFSLEISPSTIRRYIRKTLKWTVVRTRFGSMISAANKVKRHKFAKMCIDTKDTFDNVIWMDESSVQLVCHSQIMRVKIGKEQILKLAPKHAAKILKRVPQSMQPRYQREEQL